MKEKPKIIVILGQTATGKSDFAVEVALHIHSGSSTKEISGLNQPKGLVARTSRSEVLGEIISADSRQVYKGMDLGTGKVTKKEMKGVPHHLLDIVSPAKKIFSVSDFQKLANKKIKEIIGKNKVPIICGGTGFYIDSVINENIFPEVPPNEKLRKELYSKSAIALFEYLKKIDPRRAKNIDPNNKIRLIRAIEIAKALGKVPSLSPRSDLGENNFEVLKIGLTFPPEILKERIYSRLISRIKKGMIKEIKDLHEKEKVSWKKLESFGLEYRHVALFLQGKLTKEEMLKKLNSQIWHFAKRQKTWFKRDPNILWINPSKKADRTKALQTIDKFLK